MRFVNLIIGLVAFATGTSAMAAPPTLADIGPAPNWDQAVQLGTRAILSRLIDPDSARIAWPNAFIGGSLKALFGKTRAGWYTCGLVNARNRMGGFTGATPFLILMRNGALVSLDIGEVGGEDTATITCTDLEKKEAFQPSGAGDMPTPISAATPIPSPQAIEQAGQALAAAAAKKGGIGISFLATPAGAVLLAVAPNSIAASAGLKAGQVIQSANGIDLKGMPQAAVLAVLHGLPKQIKFQVIGAGAINLMRP